MLFSVVSSPVQFSLFLAITTIFPTHLKAQKAGVLGPSHLLKLQSIKTHTHTERKTFDLLYYQTGWGLALISCTTRHWRKDRKTSRDLVPCSEGRMASGPCYYVTGKPNFSSSVK